MGVSARRQGARQFAKRPDAGLPEPRSGRTCQPYRPAIVLTLSV